MDARRMWKRVDNTDDNMATKYPGYMYDEGKKCYFYIPPKHFEQFSQNKKTYHHVTMQDATASCSLYNHLQQRTISVKENLHSIRILTEHAAPTMKKRGELRCDHLEPNFSTYNDILINESGELFAVYYSPDNTIPVRYTEIFHIKFSKLSYSNDMIWNSSSPADPAQGYHSMNFITDQHDYHHFISLSSDCISFAKYLHDELKWSKTKTLPKPALYSKIFPNYNEWHTSYYVLGFCNGIAEVYCHHHKPTYSTTSMKSSILSLACSFKGPLLFSGYRNGMCCVWDTRAYSSPSVIIQESPARPKISSSVIGIHPLYDQNYVISNALNSKLSMWDLRMRGKVLEFNGHINEYKNCKSIVDKLGSLVAAVGSDGSIRIWSIRTGKLIHCLNESYNGELPLITYTESLSGVGGRPSLLVTESNNIMIYQI